MNVFTIVELLTILEKTYLNMMYYIWGIIICLSLIFTAFVIEIIVQSKCSDDSKFKKWWRRHIVSDQDFEPKN
jgi:hypothetical protein